MFCMQTGWNPLSLSLNHRSACLILPRATDQAKRAPSAQPVTLSSTSWWAAVNSTQLARL